MATDLDTAVSKVLQEVQQAHAAEGDAANQQLLTFLFSNPSDSRFLGQHHVNCGQSLEMRQGTERICTDSDVLQ